MIGYFFRRYARLFAILAGLTAYRLVLPDDAEWWLELAVALSVGAVVYLLLYKDGVTANRPNGKGTGL